ncbi:MFS family permease [Arcicella rosea]|uniref:MFS family permease n=1 Tax=Arcicella rosea TaxID=502909 RepID=A0A841EMG7_9BACT|nr:MFS family permease [Arcicella rosea]
MEAKLGLKENWQQFTLLVIVNAFVGGMVGLERSIIPQLAEHEFGIVSKVAILSFITAFGFSKATANYFAGRFADKIGRKNLLTIGWLMALQIPFILIYANNWQWVIMANVLLGNVSARNRHYFADLYTQFLFIGYSFCFIGYWHGFGISYISKQYWASNKPKPKSRKYWCL